MIFLSIISTIVFGFISIVLLLAGLPIQYITNNADIVKIDKLVKWKLCVREKRPCGIVIGKNPDISGCGWFIGWTEITSARNSRPNSWIIATPKFADKLFYSVTKKCRNPNRVIVARLSGNIVYNLTWIIDYMTFDIKLNNDQMSIVDSVVKYYKEKPYCSFFIEGEPGTGKSTIGIEVAKVLDAVYVSNFSLDLLGQNFNTTIETIRRKTNADKPIIIMLEEFDRFLNAIVPFLDVNDKLREHKNLVTTASNKSEVNAFFDMFSLGCKDYQNIIIIATSNTPKKIIDAADSSLLRTGRFQGHYNLTEKVC